MTSAALVVGLVVFRDLLETWQAHRGLRAVTFKKPPPPRPPKTEGAGND